MNEEQMRWPDTADQEPAPGWAAVRTPLGAGLHVLINAPSWDLCTEWQLLHAGRGRLAPTDPFAWFSQDELAHAPQGLVAELFADGQHWNDFARLISANAEARRHILALPDYVHGVEPDEWAQIGRCVELARCLDARAAAQAAAKDATKG